MEVGRKYTPTYIDIIIHKLQNVYSIELLREKVPVLHATQLYCLWIDLFYDIRMLVYEKADVLPSPTFEKKLEMMVKTVWQYIITASNKQIEDSLLNTWTTNFLARWTAKMFEEDDETFEDKFRFMSMLEWIELIMEISNVPSDKNIDYGRSDLYRNLTLYQQYLYLIHPIFIS